MAKKEIVPQKKNYVQQFLKQRDINSYYSTDDPMCTVLCLLCTVGPGGCVFLLTVMDDDLVGKDETNGEASIGINL